MIITLAVLADIPDNRVALQAVLDNLDAQGRLTSFKLRASSLLERKLVALFTSFFKAKMGRFI